MKSPVFRLLLSLALLPAVALPDDAPAPVMADIHTAVKGPNPNLNQFMRNLGLRAGRYEIRNAAMVDLVRAAYGYDLDKILGGPNWVEMDHFDVTVKMDQDTPPDEQKTILQSVLADRFQLVVHKEDKPLPTFALRQGKKLLMKPADGGGEPGCRPQAAAVGPAQNGTIIIGGMVAGGNAGSAPVAIRIGPDGLIAWECRSVTMASFVSNLRTMIGAGLGTNPLLDETGLEGAWNFDLKYSLTSMANADHVSLQEAVDKQLGLKLEPKTVPTPVLVIDKVSHQPTPNPPDIEKVLPPVVIPTEFDVASLKPSAADARGGRFQTQPGGRLLMENIPLQTLVMRAFNSTNPDAIAGLPKFALTDCYDVNAKAPAQDPGMPPLDADSMSPMILSLLKDRFKMTYHTEDREVSAYSLIAVKPKLKKANPENRTNCKNQPGPPGSPNGTREYVCQNMTMAQLAEKLQTIIPGPILTGMYWPIVDATGIEGNWDVTLTFSLMATMQGRMNFVARGVVDGAAATAGGAPTPSAEEPSGGISLFDALEKQAGLKLDLQKRTAKVIVIDHLEQKPTEN